MKMKLKNEVEVEVEDEDEDEGGKSDGVHFFFFCFLEANQRNYYHYNYNYSYNCYSYSDESGGDSVCMYGNIIPGGISFPRHETAHVSHRSSSYHANNGKKNTTGIHCRYELTAPLDS